MAVTTTTTTMNSSKWKINECLMVRLTTFLIFSSISSYTALGLGSNLTRRGGCIESEMLSLLSLKEGIYQPPGSWLSSWRAGTDCCTWRGVGCDHTTGHVIKLNLRYPYVHIETDDDGYFEYVYYDYDYSPSPMCWVRENLVEEEDKEEEMEVKDCGSMFAA